MEYVILGLLSLRPLTIYDINKALQKSISLFYSASFGSITAALSKMLHKGWVTSETKVEGGRNKRLFSLTPQGRQTFHAWLASAIPPEQVKDPALTRVFFLGLLPAAERIRVLESHLQNLRATLATLDALQCEVDITPVTPEFQDAAEYQKLTLQYGRDYYAFSIAWYQRLIEKLKTAQG